MLMSWSNLFTFANIAQELQMVLQSFLRAGAFIASSIQGSRIPSPSQADGGSWAILTGSTSGVGLALASELCSRGYNVILHGRNTEKLKAVQSDLRSRFPIAGCELLVLDAATCFSLENFDTSHNSISQVTENRNIVLLINNVGIGHNLTEDFRSLTSQSAASIDLILNTNIGFMTHLTRLLIPALSKGSSSFVINVGSLSELAMPYIAVYSATKAYISTFTKALDAEMRAENLGISVECMLFGDIDTPVHPMDQSLSVLRANKAAKCILDQGGWIGSWGLEPVGAPYWFHAVLLWLCQIQHWGLLRAGFIQNLKDKAKKTA